MPDFGWDYPPGVSASDPHLTGEHPCRVCDGTGCDESEGDKHNCTYCRGMGIDPEEPPYCLNCDNMQYKQLYFNIHTDLILCDACKPLHDIQPDEESSWEEW